MTATATLRVVHVITSARVGGMQRLVLQLAARQTDLAAKVLILQDGGSLLGEFRDHGVDHEVLGLRAGLRFERGRIARARRLFADADIVHFHVFHPLLAREAVAAGARIVFTEHGNFGFGRKTTWRDRTKRVLMRRFLNRHVDFITFNSRFSRSLAEKRYGLALVDRDVVYNGAEASLPGRPVDDVIRNRLDGFVIGTVCRLAGVKRVDRLLSAVARIEDLRLLVVGDGPLRGSLERRAEELGILGRTVFAGEQRDVAAFIDLMDVFVLPSANESFGLVVVEALARGRPCLVFADGGGATEIVGADDIVRDEAHLATRLEQYRRDGTGDGRARVARAAEFGLEEMCRRFGEVYARVV